MAEKKEVHYHYIKSNDFRTVSSNGVWGGINSEGLINVNFFTDRIPLPTKTTSVLTEGKWAEDESQREVKDGIIREVQFGVLMSVEAAKIAVKFLQHRIDILEKNKKG